MIVLIVAVEAQQTTLLFAFGDSYADVGNTPRTGPNTGKGWIYPYGITWPNTNGPPAGRFSDGKVQTDWISKPHNLITISLFSRLMFQESKSC